MATQPAQTSWYASRFQPIVAALIGACFIALAVFFWLNDFSGGLVSWLATGPLHVVGAAIIGLFGAAIALWGLYWTFKPIPLLSITAEGLAYAPSPFRRINVTWTDVTNLSVAVAATPLPPTANPEAPESKALTGSHALITLTIERVAAPTLIIDLAPASIGTTTDDLLRALQTYHEAHWVE